MFGFAKAVEKSSEPQSGGLFPITLGVSQQQVGTTIKFVAPSDTDSISKNGQQVAINTNHQCITEMKEYRLKSLEELRFEDYQVNRKGIKFITRKFFNVTLKSKTQNIFFL